MGYYVGMGLLDGPANRRRQRLQDTSVAAIIGASFGAIAARFTAYMAMREDVNAIRRNVSDGLVIADAIENYQSETDSAVDRAVAAKHLVGTDSGRISNHEPEHYTSDDPSREDRRAEPHHS
jgi:hypothetical protein